MIINTIEQTEVAAALIAQVGKRCEVAVRTPGADGYGIHVTGVLVMEGGSFSVTCPEKDGGNGCAVFQTPHVQSTHLTKRGTLQVGLKVGGEPAPDSLHEWWVFSTALAEGWLMLHCEKTGCTGSVRDPSREEWSKAFSAPSAPYRWYDDARVHPDLERRTRINSESLNF